MGFASVTMLEQDLRHGLQLREKGTNGICAGLCTKTDRPSTQVAVENGIKEGFDFALAHQLISACFTHRKLLSKGSATQINRWYEQFRRLKKGGGKRKRKTEPSQPTGPLLVDPTVKTVTVADRYQKVDFYARKFSGMSRNMIPAFEDNFIFNLWLVN
ncbi:unnamed protein product [Angiostrongylus costaricensis]|uniref:Zmiz1_N domain-containing protein n=1 Tax=Angiostrongylus costaricensis TaxID=334426 RepID=A0A0R3P9L1_ANGCS|nr:unnamed protein product [Angiostrongylus costaricensis]